MAVSGSRRKWQVKRARAGSTTLTRLLDAGWEPFSTTFDQLNREWIHVRLQVFK